MLFLENVTVYCFIATTEGKCVMINESDMTYKLFCHCRNSLSFYWFFYIMHSKKANTVQSSIIWKKYNYVRYNKIYWDNYSLILQPWASAGHIWLAVGGPGHGCDPQPPGGHAPGACTGAGGLRQGEAADLPQQEDQNLIRSKAG